MNFKQTRLWRDTFESPVADVDACKRLDVSYNDLWTKMSELGLLIQKDLPQLTLHDSRHFEALWRNASLIAGDDYKLSPIEVYVLGCSILFHDAANCLAAYAGGLSEVQNTDAWRDAEFEYRSKSDNDDGELSDSAVKSILLQTLRHIHAERARYLPSEKVTRNGFDHYLISDEEIRNHLADIIGKISASHHWDVADLTKRLPEESGIPTAFPAAWELRPIVVACLLRCADASQLDQSRAPDFLMALLKIGGESALHWVGQNRLAAPKPSRKDASALRFVSTKPFDSSEAKAWWLIYEAIEMASRELSSCDALLRDIGEPAFQLNRIEGAQNPRRLSELITVNDWQPIDARVKASRIDKIVDMFGGEQLYGQRPVVAIRELIQNAADAVGMRRSISDETSAYQGNIRVRLIDDITSDTVSIVVADDGIGMSEGVMTGPLIDFGNSYLSSTLVKYERPGLLAKRKRNIGQFGIGFFSVFMIADKVEVTSKPFDSGVSEYNSLIFDSSDVVRPTLTHTGVDGEFDQFNTVINLTIQRREYEKLLTYREGAFSTGKKVSLRKLISHITCMIDVDVFFSADTSYDLVHSSKWHQEKNNWPDWLRNTCIGIDESRAGSIDFEADAELMDFLDESNPGLGLAAVSYRAGGGLRTIGGLAATGFGLGNGPDEYFGAIDYTPFGPNRMPKSARDSVKLAEWANRQAIAYSKLPELSDRDKIILTKRIAKFGGDPLPIAVVSVRRNIVPIGEVVQGLIDGQEYYCSVRGENLPDGDKFYISRISERMGFATRPLQDDEIETSLNLIESNGDSDDFFRLPIGGDTSNRMITFIGLLQRELSNRGFELAEEILHDFELGKYIGLSSERDGIQSGEMISPPYVLKFTAMQS